MSMEKIVHDIDAELAAINGDMLALQLRRERLQKAREALVGPLEHTPQPLPERRAFLDFTPEVFVPSYPLYPLYYGSLGITVTSGPGFTQQPPASVRS